MVVKVRKRGRPKGGGGLEATRIVERTAALLRDDGKVPSVRKLAGELGVDPMAIYHYFPSKAALLEAVGISLMESIYMPRETAGWERELERLCLSYLELLDAHPGLLETLLSMAGNGPAQVFASRFETVMQPLGIGERTVKNALDLLADYLHGFALAMRCSPDGALNISMVNGPLALLIKGLKAEAEGE